jgi:hypothetical protein
MALTSTDFGLVLNLLKWPIFILTLSVLLLTGCGDDEAADKARAKASPNNKPAPVAVKFGTNSVDDILRSIMLLKIDDHAGMQQVIRNNAAGYCTEGKLGAGINQLPVETTASQSRREQSNTFAMKDALQDAMAPLEGRYRVQQVKQLFAGILRWNDQVYIRTIVMGCFVKVPTGKNAAKSN